MDDLSLFMTLLALAGFALWTAIVCEIWRHPGRL